MQKKMFDKDPDATLDYSVDWRRWLTSDEITSVAFAVNGSDSVLEISDEGQSGGIATVWLTAGTVGVIYEVTCHVETDDGRVDERSFRVRVVER